MPIVRQWRPSRRRLLAAAGASMLTYAGSNALAGGVHAPADKCMLTVHTFGDSVLDCGRYNDEGVHPGALLVRNNNQLFPEFSGRDLQARGPARLDHRAVDGATVDGLFAQARGLRVQEPALALLTIGGNDLIRGLAGDTSDGIRVFEHKLGEFLKQLPVRPVLMASVYDPTFGDDTRNFLSVDASIARANHRRVNTVIATLAQQHGGQFVDLHTHFLQGNPSWFTHTIEPSLRGASEVRRMFLAALHT